MNRSFLHMVCSATIFAYISTEAILIQLQFSLISYVAGGSSIGCPENAGAAGTFYESVPRSLTVSNHHKSTYTDTLLMDFPQPFLTNVYIRNQAKAAVPLLWSRVQVSEVGVI